jgi:hypothetical protein
MSMAKEHDPKGERTLCVVTKPDMVDEHDLQELLKLIRNESSPLTLGYAVVRGRKTNELANVCSVCSS